MRLGRLLRSAHHAQASDEDLARLSAIPVSVVIDPRRPRERLRDPSRRPATFAPRVIQTEEGDGDAPHIAFLRQGDLSDEAVERYLLGYYRAAPFQPHYRDLFARAFAALAEEPGALLIHCTAGKDRTGLLAALIRAALGGGWDETVADYMLTNAVMLTPARIAQAAPGLTTLIGAPPSEAILHGFLGVQPQHLQASFDEIDARHGSLDHYLAWLGVDDARRARLIEQLVV